MGAPTQHSAGNWYLTLSFIPLIFHKLQIVIIWMNLAHESAASILGFFCLLIWPNFQCSVKNFGTACCQVLGKHWTCKPCPTSQQGHRAYTNSQCLSYLCHQFFFYPITSCQRFKTEIHVAVTSRQSKTCLQDCTLMHILHSA